MGIKVIGIRLTKPMVEGFPDSVNLYDSETGELKAGPLRFGTNPNPIVISGPHAGQPWYAGEGQLAEGTYHYQCWNSPKHGKCLMLNPIVDGKGNVLGGGACATTNPDPNDNGEMHATNVEVHTGFKGEIEAAAEHKQAQRGSLACQTIDPDDSDEFWSYFEIGDEGDYILKDGTV